MPFVRFWAVIFVLSAGCFGLSLGDEPFVCGGDGTECPPGYDCVFGVCTRQGLPDAAPPDAAVECTPNALLECVDGDSARVCNGEGNAVLDLECPGGCSDVCVRCEPGTVTCVDGELETCGPGGDVIARKTCHAGCDGSAEPNACLHLDPQNLPADACAGSDATDVVVDGDLAWDTASCTTFGGARVTTETGETACVVTVRKLSVTDRGTLRATGDVPLIVVALEDMKLAGRIAAGGTGTTSGPGGSQAQGTGGSVDGESNQGGGGGGHLTLGGMGGSGGTGPKVTIPGGDVHGDPSLAPLAAGSRGGRGGDPCGLGGCPITPIDRSGGGGGAVQLVACRRLEIAPTARIDAGGGGGGGGNAAQVLKRPELLVPAGGGSGGGAGGAILVEAPEIAIPGGAKVTACGGGGGGGGGLTAGTAGRDATDEIAAQGGGGGGAAGGRGGIGLEADVTPQAGASHNGVGAGGGGGAAGRIRFNSRPDRPVEIAPGARVYPTSTRGEISRSL
jgi:hypothetical protein